jgi:hypothetical protein
LPLSECVCKLLHRYQATNALELEPAAVKAEVKVMGICFLKSLCKSWTLELIAPPVLLLKKLVVDAVQPVEKVVGRVQSVAFHDATLEDVITKPAAQVNAECCCVGSCKRSAREPRQRVSEVCHYPPPPPPLSPCNLYSHSST